MNEFLELVTERPDPKLSKKGIFCPYCKSKEVQTFGTRSTLVGYFGVDRNHTWTECRCSKCQKEFTWETKGFDRVWVTDPNGKVLLGIPRCFEYYVYTCKHCGSDVKLKHFNIDDDKEATTGLSYSVVDGKSTPHQYHVFQCDGCGEKVKTENYYYDEG